MPVVSEPPAIRRSIPHRRFRPLAESPPVARPGLYAGEPENCRRRPREFLAIMAQLGLMLAVFDAYRLEARSFRFLVLLAAAALPFHYLAPYRWKKPLFLLVSIMGMVLVHGLSTSGGVLAVSAGLVLLAAAPLPWRIQVALFAAIAAALAVLRPRADPGAEAISTGVIPVVATMFMFRMIVYLYERKHARDREPILDTMSYFLLLPNYVFPHFPVVDYRAFRRGYFARGIHEIQRAGLAMMTRGTLHLLAYRAIDRMLLISPDAVNGPLSLAGYLVCNDLLYLRVSGQFHMACGLLHLFGFQLPETHHRYLLASSFTDYWRRINIYWKDFMVRVVFNPVVFRLKRRPQPVALGVATAVVFLVTWLLHAYQSFWLRGVWGFGGPDALFWGILGVLVLINVQLEARRGGRRAPDGSGAAPRLALRALRVAGTFATIATLWSLWSSPSVASWVAMIRRGLMI
jgi:D-alanyl-lipoteichoic acid acyltransferase DltB (MBOAT superfamily)